MGDRTKRRSAKHEQGSPPASLARRLAPALISAAVAFAAFAPTLPYELVWDDRGLVQHVESSWRQGGLSGLLCADFTIYDNPGLSPGYYRPAALLSLRGDGAMAPSFPYAYHATNVLLHTLNTALVYWLLALVLRAAAPALMGALLFAVHPAHVESVAFVSGRTDLLAALFALLSTLTWLRVRAGLSRNPARDRAVSCGSFFLACLSKEVAYLLPAVLLIWDLAVPAASPTPSGWRRHRSWVMGWAGCFAVVVVLRWSVSTGSLGLLRAGAHQGSLTAAVSDPMLIPSVLAGYLRLLVLPWPLQAYYTQAQLMSTGAALVWFLGPILVTGLAWRIGAGRIWLAALAWLLLFLLPVSGIVPIGGAAIAERYLYLPSVGFVLAAGLLFDRLGGSPAARSARVLAATVILGALLWISVDRSRVWRDEITLFSDVTRTTPSLASPHYNLGTAYLDLGRHAEAVAELEQAVRLLPDHARFHTNLGLAYLHAGRNVDALRAQRRALDIDPSTLEAWDNLGLVLIVMERWDEAIAACRRSIEIRSDNPIPRLNLVVALSRSGHEDDAKVELAALERLSPEHARRARAALATMEQQRRRG